MIVHPKPADFACVRAGGAVGVGIRVAQFLNGTGFKDYEHALVCVGPELSVGAVIPNDLQGQQSEIMGSKVQPGEVWVQILEAMPTGARIRYRRVQETDLWSTDIISQTPAQRSAAERIAPSFKGIPYSFLDYDALVARRLHVPNLKIWPIPDVHRRLHLVTLQDYIGWTGHLICSQLVDEFESQIGTHLFKDSRWPGDVTPGDLANMLYNLYQSNTGTIHPNITRL